MYIEAYPRPDGTFGIRNKILVLSTCGCANETAARIAARAEGAVCIQNPKGCGQIGLGREIAKRCLTGFALNPNVYGTILVGLGCETLPPAPLYDHIAALTKKPLEMITIQEEGGTLRAIEKGVRLAQTMSLDMSRQSREKTDISHLLFATNCGGSDATSGIAANPALGACSDLLVAAGGVVMIGETTELIGAEHLLARRAKTPEVAKRVLLIVQTLERRLAELGIDIRGVNPSPGNIKGGLSTLEEKSVGGITKGGTTPITEVTPYGVRPVQKGLIIMDTPGYDIESVTGMVAGGAQLCAFTTGRGTPTGNPLVPVLKITGNAETWHCMEDDTDIDVSAIVRGEMSIAQGGKLIFDQVIAVCNGQYTKAELHGYTESAVYRNYEIWCDCI